MKDATVDTAQKPVYAIEHGPLSKTYGLFVPGTINTGSQISLARVEDAALRSQSFYTANAPFATKRQGKLLLGIGGNAAFNAVLDTIQQTRVKN